MVMLHHRPGDVEAAVAHAACAVADAEAQLARARRELGLACSAYAARLAGGDRPRAAATTAAIADLEGQTIPSRIAGDSLCC